MQMLLAKFFDKASLQYLLFAIVNFLLSTYNRNVASVEWFLCLLTCLAIAVFLQLTIVFPVIHLNF
jgi:hypothetical protein